MKDLQGFHRGGVCNIAAGLLLMTCTTSVWATEVTIYASFQPDSGNTQRNQFKNDTVPSGYCAINPRPCADNRMFSLRVPIGFNSNGPIQANHENARQGAMIKVPAQWQELTVYHETTGQPHQVKVRIAGFGSTYITEDVVGLVGGGVSHGAAHALLWGSDWVYAPSPCIYSGYGLYGNAHYRFFWKTPIEAACVKQAKFDIPWMKYEYVDFAYELITPNPLEMSSGKYRGPLTYTIGPGLDFDMGDVMLPDTSTLTLNFELDVQHTLKVDVPPGGNRVELVPQGGWQSWLTQGRKPTRLFRDQTFNISASSQFKMQMECQHNSPDGKGCALLEPVSGHVVPLNVSVSLPFGLTDASEQPINHRLLLLDGSGTEKFQPKLYVDRKPGTLHFEVPQSEVAGMIGTGPQRKYSGNVTVIWDSDI